MSAQNADYQHVKTENICLCVNLEKRRGQTICGHKCTAGVFWSRGTESQPEWMKEVHWVLSSAFQISVFSSGVSRAKQREQCLGSALPLWHSFKGPCSTDGHCLGWECTGGYSQSVSVLSFELISAPARHFPNTHPPPFLTVSHFLPVRFVIPFRFPLNVFLNAELVISASYSS